jgi:Condensation domain
MASTNGKGFRLSPQQKHLWSLQKPDYKLPYRSGCAISISGRLSRAALKAALQQVVNRHEILRSSFHCQAGLKVPFQVVEDEASVTWQDFDLSGMEPNLQKIETGP